MTPPQKQCERPGCTNLLTGRQKRFCSNSCKMVFEGERKRRLAASVALEEVRAQVSPVVREALTESVLLEIKALTELLPEAIKTLTENLQAATGVDAEGVLQPDYAERRQAAAIILKYTVGIGSITSPAEANGSSGVNIMFGLPMQGDKVAGAEGSVLGEALEEPEADERECLECHQTKAAEDFVGSSDRCQVCHDAMIADIHSKFPGMLPGAGDAGR